MSTAPARACPDCQAWPCICIRNPDRPMEFSIRTETCACGGRFTSGGSSDNVARAIRWHNQTPRHQAWRAQKEAQS